MIKLWGILCGTPKIDSGEGATTSAQAANFGSITTLTKYLSNNPLWWPKPPLEAKSTLSSQQTLSLRTLESATVMPLAVQGNCRANSHGSILLSELSIAASTFKRKLLPRPVKLPTRMTTITTDEAQTSVMCQAYFTQGTSYVTSDFKAGINDDESSDALSKWHDTTDISEVYDVSTNTVTSQSCREDDIQSRLEFVLRHRRKLQVASSSPSMEPTRPTIAPTFTPTIKRPPAAPTGRPRPTARPSRPVPTFTPTIKRPPAAPTGSPKIPTNEPTEIPTQIPTEVPFKTSAEPTATPSATPTSSPSAVPTATPSATPTSSSSGQPTSMSTDYAGQPLLIFAPTGQPVSPSLGRITIPTFKPSLSSSPSPLFLTKPSSSLIRRPLVVARIRQVRLTDSTVILLLHYFIKSAHLLLCYFLSCIQS